MTDQPGPGSPSDESPSDGSLSAGSSRDGARGRVGPALLGQLIREARNEAKRRKGAGWTLDYVAEQAGLRRPALVAIERGDRLPSIAALARLHALLPRPDGRPRTAGDLAFWLARWARAQVERAARPSGDGEGAVALGAMGAGGPDDELGPELRQVLHQAAAMVDRAVTPPGHDSDGGPRTLADFPSRFPAMVALVGDRRERPPRSRGDLFVAAAAITDVSFLPLLASGVVASIRSDKLVAVDDRVAENDLRGVDLLVLAGPNVNWAARRVNAGALFRYQVPREWEEWEEAYRAEPHLGSPSLLRTFADLLNAGDGTGRSRGTPTVREEADPEALAVARRLLRRPGGGGTGWVTEPEVIDAFRGAGHTDPVAGTVHRADGESLVDHALVSLAPSPFDPSRLAILVGGTHGPGTAHAVRFLVESSHELGERPYGGVLEVRMGEYVDWSSKFQQPAVVRWLTPRYTPAEIRERFVTCRDPGARSLSPALADRTPAQIEAAIAFVNRLLTPPPTA